MTGDRHARAGSTEWWPRLRLALIVVGLLVVVPVAVAGLVAGTVAAIGMAIGSAITAAGAVSTGVRAARLGVPSLVVGIGLGALLAGTWWWVGLVAVLAAAAGLASGAGATLPVMFGAVMAVAVPAIDPGAIGPLVVFVALGCGYGLVLVERFGVPTGQPLSHPITPPVLAVLFAALAACTASVAMLIDDPHAGWIPMTALILAIPTSTGTSARSRERIVGTLIGAAVAIAIEFVGPSRPVSIAIAIGSLLMVVATAGLRYRIQAAFVTLLTLSIGTAPGESLAGRRVAYTAIGAAVLIVAVALVRPRIPPATNA